MEAHLGVRFVKNGDPSPGTIEPELTDATARSAIARRLDEGLAFGDVAALETLARELIGRSDGETALGRRMVRLVTDLDFDGLRGLAHALTESKSRPAGA
jgi:hypothetical protein